MFYIHNQMMTDEEIVIELKTYEKVNFFFLLLLIIPSVSHTVYVC
jgi:hypothetical protein